jgi:hypothetical protein
MVKADFHHRALIQLQVAIGEVSGERASAGAYTGSDAGSFTATGSCAAYGTHTGTHRNGLDHVAIAHAFAFDLTFGVRLLHAVFAGKTRESCDKRHFAVTGIDLVETDQHARVDALFDRTDMPDYALASGNHRPIGADEIFRQACFEMFALF